MQNTIVVLGSSNTDMIVKTERIPRPGETVIGGVFSKAPGGKGANQAVAAARAGGSVVFIGRVGADMLGEEALAGYICDGIDVSRVTRDPDAYSGVALIFVDAKGENSIAVASGANANVTPADVEAARDRIESAAVLLMQLEIPIEAVRAAADIAVARGVRVILNPAPARALDDALLRNISILTPNETEAELLTGISADTDRGVENATEALRARGIETVLLTLGTRGVYIASPEYRGIVPCYPVECVDSTAAGDVFNGVLAASLADGRILLDAVRFASAAAAISVTRMGAQPSAPYREEIEVLFRERG